MSISTQSAPERIIAFEVSKASLTVHLMPEDRQVVIENTPKAISKLLRKFDNLETSFAICEASGGYERHVLACCAAASLPVHRAHGTRTRNFARFLGLVSKTDSIDARMLALFAQKSDGLRLWEATDPEAEELRALRRRRDDLAKIMRVEQNRLEHATVKTVRLSLQRHVRTMTREMAGLDKQIAELVAATPAFKRKAELMQSIKGIGPKKASACLAYLPELGSLSKGEAAAIVGLAPYAKDSGTYQGHRHVAGGRKDVRASLYMAALSALRSNPAIRDFAAKLKARGKPSKVILTAIMRKLIVIMNAVLKEGQASNRYGAA